MTLPRNIRIAGEMALAFGALLLLDRWIGADMFRTVQPHPFWLPVLAMALVYGAGPGLAAAAVATGLWITAPHPTLAIGEDPFDRLVALSIGPMLWMAAAALIGEVSSARMRRIALLDRRAAMLARNTAALTEAHQTLVSTNRTLRVRIATEERGVAEAIAAVPGLIHPHPAARLRTIARLVELDAGSDDFSVYMEQDGVWHRFLRGSGATLDVTTLSPSLVARVATSETPLPIDAPVLDGVGVVALAVGTDDAPLASVLVFHNLPIERFTQRGMIDLLAVAGRLGPLLADEGLRRAGQQTRLRVVGSDLVA
ncbi:hypothetical protein [Sphingomonas sp. Leaf343]|uniref:hypothetical protein n=1 Tax=Sphingomonas sp. Leaf343 TaxID=1736345 RepID=UPI000AB6DEDF|nr:hypothetical protein [Sphingomonas sp. Leaf343]